MGALAALALCLLTTLSPAVTATDPDKADFAVEFRDDVIPYRVFGVYVLPGETISISTKSTQVKGETTLEVSGGEIEHIDAGAWRWTAPEQPGHVELRLSEARSGDSVVLNAFIKTPFDHRGERLNGYRIGHYEAEPLRGNPVYERPQGFVKVTPANRDLRVSPNFTLEQFLCKQEGGPPDYLVLRERLLLKLEMILRKVREMGIEADSLHIMSGFRTPYYNHAIGNTTDYSRHLYGGAADIFVDTDNDGTMDDLNDDGVVNTTDANVLADIVRDNADAAWYRPFTGGLSVYGPAPHRGPFVHVDVRGFRARW